jgi:hypothetical protein
MPQFPEMHPGRADFLIHRDSLTLKANHVAERIVFSDRFLRAGLTCLRKWHGACSPWTSGPG